MIGEHHVDPKVEPKLRKVLEDFKPERILLEGCEEIDRSLVIIEEELRRILALRNDIHRDVKEALIWIQGAYNASYKAVKDYCAVSGATYGFLNDKKSEFADEKAVKAYIGNRIKDASKLSVGDMMDEWTMHESMAAPALRRIKKAYDTSREEESIDSKGIGPRDVIMQATLDRELVTFQGERMATLTGAAHVSIVPRRNSFFCLAKAENVTRTILFDE